MRRSRRGRCACSRSCCPTRCGSWARDHPDTLTTRSNIASWTGECGDAAGALRLFQELLPDRVRVLGPGHPDTLTTRGNIAYWTKHLSASAQRPQGAIEAEDPGNTGALPLP